MSQLNLFGLFIVLNLLPVHANEKILLGGTLSVIFNDVFKPRGMSVSILVNMSNEENYRYSQDILQTVLSTNKDIQVPVAINQNTEAKLTQHIQIKMIFTNNAENLRLRMEYLFHQGEIQYEKTKYLIILTANITLQEKLNEMHKIFEDFFNFYILNVVILVYGDNLLQVYTYKPYNEQHCDYTRPVLVYSFNKIPASLYYDDLYPIKTNNFYQCPMKVVLWNVPPFVELQWQNNKIVNVQGHDVLVLKSLSKYLNFSIEIMPNEPPNYISGDVTSNMTPVGVFKILVERRTNITLGTLTCLTRRLQLSSGSIPYFVSELIIVLRNSQKYTSFQLLLRPFQTSTWILFVAMLILRSLLKRLPRKHHKLYNTSRPLFRLQWLFFIFLLRSSYEGSMFEAIRNSPYQTLPQTVNEVIEQNYSLITEYSIARVLDTISPIRRITHVVNNTHVGVLESLDSLPDKTGVISYTVFVSAFMKNRQSNHSNYAIVRDKVANTVKCMFFPRLSFMTEPVNNFIKRFSQFGVFYKYSKTLGFENMPYTTDRLKANYNSNAQIPLDFEFLRAVFIILLILHILAIVVFLLELLSIRFKILRNIFGKF